MNDAPKKDKYATIHTEYYTRANRVRAGRANAVRRIYIYMADGSPETYKSLAQKTGLTEAAVRHRVDRLRQMQVPLTTQSIREYAP